MRKVWLLLFTLILGACASQQKLTPPSMPDVSTKPVSEPESENIDYESLQTFLKLDRARDHLGYAEKSFNTCDVGYGYSSNRNCRRDYFVLIHFQLMCRDSHQETYTEALSVADMQPLKGRSVKWTLSKKSGDLLLDDRGYGQIRTTTRVSPRSQRLKINVGNDNLYIKAGEFNRIVTPANWCY